MKRLSSSRVSSNLSSTMKRLSSTLMKRKHQLGHSQKLSLINENQGHRRGGVPLAKEVNTRLSKVYGLATRQRVSPTLQGFEYLTRNEKVKLFKNSIQTYVQYPKEVRQKGKKVAMKIISHAWRTYKSRLVKCLRDKKNSFDKFKDLTQEDRERFVAKCKSENFAVNSQYMQ
jgi:hypothetical protein